MTRALPYMGALVEIHVNPVPSKAMFSAPPDELVQASVSADSAVDVVVFHAPSRRSRVSVCSKRRRGRPA